MSRIHDIGGMQGMGEINHHPDAPMFDEKWESRVMALAVASAFASRMGSLRESIETIPTKDFLQMSSYERWLAGIISWAKEVGVLTEEEIETGRSNGESGKTFPPLSPEVASKMLFRSFRTELDVEVTPKYRLGERVRVRNEYKDSHTRRPSYTRGKEGIIMRDNGVFGLPDNEVYDLEPRPQHTYQVRFSARELWGKDKPEHDKLYIDMWEDYLEPA